MEIFTGLVVALAVGTAAYLGPPRLKGEALLAPNGNLRVRIRNAGFQDTTVTAAELLWGTGPSPQVLQAKRTDKALLGQLPRNESRTGWFKIDLKARRGTFGEVGQYPISVKLVVGHGLRKRKPVFVIESRATDKMLAAPWSKSAS